MQEWKSRRKNMWDGLEANIGEAERTAWEPLLEMEKYEIKANELDEVAVTIVVDFAKASQG